MARSNLTAQTRRTRKHEDDLLTKLAEHDTALDHLEVRSPVAIPVTLAAHSNGTIAARFTPGFAGRISKITASVVVVASTADKLATFTPAIAGTPTTGGALALTTANCATLGAKVDGSAVTAANAFTNAQEITIVASSVTAFVEGQVVVYLYLIADD